MQKKNNKLHPSVKKIFLIIGGFFVLFFIAIGITIYIAQKNFEPITDKRYYEKGLNYEERKNAFKNAKEKNWNAEINILNNNTLKKDFSLEIKFKNSKYLQDFFSDKERTVAILKISYPATIKKFYEYTFKENDFNLNQDKIEMKKNISLPSNGNFEFTFELYPEKNAIMFFTKKIYVE